MTRSGEKRTAERIGFDQACAALHEALRGPARRTIVERSLSRGSPASALRSLREQLAAHDFRGAVPGLELRRLVRDLDARGIADGFHVLLEWEQAAGRFSADEVPVLLLDHVAAWDAGWDPAALEHALALILDFYFLYVVALALLRAWDEGDPNANLDRVTALLGELQDGPGSGQRFASDAGTLFFVATSNFQPDGSAYPRLLEKVRRLDHAHRVGIARIGAPVVGTHLRWAFSAIYEHDLQYMRRDNDVDYPWLFLCSAFLMDEYARMHEAGVARPQRSAVVGALLNGLTPDPWAFLGKAPDSLAPYAAEHRRFGEMFARHRGDLLAELRAQVPVKGAYSPLALQFNFPHNVLVARVLLALGGHDGANLPLDRLLTPPASAAEGAGALELARALTGYAAAHPERRGERRVLQVAYNEPLGLRAFARTLAALEPKLPTGTGAARGVDPPTG